MDIKRLKYFISVVEKGSIGRAAHSCNLAQPAMSQHMAALELDVGVKLLVRSPQGVTPTPAGLHFYRSAHAIVRRMEESVRETVAIGGRNAGSISIGVPTSMSSILGTPLLNLLIKQFPAIRIRMLEGLSGHLTEMALNGRIDIALAFVDSGIHGLDVKPLLLEEMFFMQPETAPDGETATLEEVADTPLVLPGPEHGLRRTVEQGLAKIGREPKIIAEIDSFQVLFDAVRQGLASTVMSWAGMTTRTAPTEARRKRIVDPQLVRPVAMCISETAMTVDRISEVETAIDRLVRALVEDGTWRGASYIGAP